MRRKPLVWAAGGLIVLFLVIRLLVRIVSPRPTTLGMINGALAACPESPNCVCSAPGDAAHKIAPLRFSGFPRAAFDRLQMLVDAQPGATLVTKHDIYLHFEFTTPVMGFTDDVEFALDPVLSVIHCRSASRLGYSDLGTNRRRIEAIRAEFEAAYSLPR